MSSEFQQGFDFDAMVEIFPVAGARNSDPDTSHMAGNSNLDLKGRHRVMVLKALYPDKELTDFELETETGVAQTSIGVRRGELCEPRCIPPLVENSGRKGLSPRNASCIKWRLTERGREVARERMRDEHGTTAY